MRHLKSGTKLGRTPAHRKALFRNMVTSLLKHERIVTTEVKAKEVGRLTEKMITLGKRGDLHARRQAIAFIKNNEVIKRLFSEYSGRYKARDGGYTRVIKLEPRSGDNAPMAIVELVDRTIQEKKAEKGKPEKVARKAEKAAASVKKTAAKKAKAPVKVKKGSKETAKSTKTEPEKTDKKTAAAPKKTKKPSSAKKKDDTPKEEEKES